ncbi:hypothetical protein EPA93_06770 [Ktedonosporobacter rubrisoli]|uniref:SnoaL-like domain-containing protein n=1 Tax=Ktedonosporobacter rubrisoli TaxID=2509675 RepID=A0A4P6JKN5_KTERU|nr:nuclear transport factor 2 family protein [Ktedonosporobacter rubrisoli]QBD75724.1 hypothetical protein EPA93_06770 [Ktedonosporobacter rubrisoli]
MVEDPIELVRNFMTALDNNEPEEYEPLLADDFTISGWTPRPLNRHGFLEAIRSLKDGIPGLTFNLHNLLSEEETRVTATWHVAGYQTDSFIIPVLGIPPIPQTGRSISLPTENVEYTLRDDKISSINVEPTAGGGVKGIIAQLGIDLPIVQ